MPRAAPAPILARSLVAGRHGHHHAILVGRAHPRTSQHGRAAALPRLRLGRRGARAVAAAVGELQLCWRRERARAIEAASERAWRQRARLRKIGHRLLAQ
eukprot:7301955-Prymnesium_polylepis.1